jgi:HKD family nuclease
VDKAVVSDKLNELLEGCKASAAVFTTFNFEPEFFELDVIPILLKQDNAFSTDERVKEFIIRDSLRESELLLEIFYDLPIFRQEGKQSPQMEYLYHGVDLRNNNFHAKSIFILVDHEKLDEKHLLVGAGSNNLTKAGWWDNIECQHWQKVKSREVDRTFLNRLREDVDWLIEHQGIVPSTQRSALHKIREFLVNCKASNSVEAVAYYGPSHVGLHGGVIKFLKGEKSGLGNYQNWTLEIISPFFAENTTNKEHDEFFKLGVDKINLFLPIDDNGHGCCEPKYFEHINKSEGISWAKWSSNCANTLGVGKEPFRRLHAKIYHFHNRKQAWAFVGSVNFTHKALKENVESGFLVKLDKVEPLLEVLAENESPDKCVLENASDDEASVQAEMAACPELHLSFDWMERTLSGRTILGESYEIVLLGPERESLIGNWRLSGEQSIYKGETDELENVLKNGSLVTVSGKSTESGELFPQHTVLLQQTGWTHKPITVQHLSPSQILAIFAGMSQERRQLLLANAHIQNLIISGYAGEMTSILEEDADNQFFCEYAEIFHAFRKLREQLYSALENEWETQVDYYLTGSGMDSLPTLLNCVDENAENNVNGVTAYLLLLSALEIYSDDNFIHRPNVTICRKNVQDEIAFIKKSDRINLDKKRQKQFFSWYEDQFSKEYVKQVIEGEAS